ncbi:MAG: DUF4340 domain-containing protein [Phycisphaerales bacterium]|nr:DUF4340 domain-containing protein [Phycisphaerales bacterium]
MNSGRMVRLVMGLAVAAVVVAVAMRVMGPNKGDTAGLGEAVVDLAQVAATINRVEVQRGTTAMVAQRGAGGWTLATRDGFPARESALQELVRGLISLRKSQRMTAMPERHSELGLAWPDPMNEARLVRVYAEGSEAPVAELLVGRSVQSPLGVFVRTVGDNQAWRCTGTMPTGSDPGEWIAGPVSDIPADFLLSLECNGVTLVKGTGGWSVVDAPQPQPQPPPATPGGEPEDPKVSSLRGTLPYLLSGLQPENVRRERPEDASRPQQVEATIRVDAGHTVDARLWKEGDDVWIRLATGECEGEPNAKLEEFAPKWAGWVFKLPSWKAGQYKALFDAPPKP